MINRRNFIKKGSLAGLSIPAISINNGIFATGNSQKIDPENFILNEITIPELQKKFEDGSVTSVQIVDMYLQRISEIDKGEIHLNSILQLNPDAKTIAASLDAERQNGKVRGPMHGVPVLIKGNIDTADKMNTNAGSLAIKDHIAKKDAFIIQKLRDAGAVILGKTNLSEWANFRSTNATSGWSSVGHQTKNPYILDRNPCGSSSGSGAAVSANLSMVAVGTETDGSIVCPASVCGIVGIKPTVGLLSRKGIIPISDTQDTAGPMARTVSDAAILLSVLAGADQQDKKTTELPRNAINDYTVFLRKDGLNGKRIGFDKTARSTNENLNQLLDHAISICAKAGAVIVEVEFTQKITDLSEKELELLKYEFKDGINKYLAETGLQQKSLSDLIQFNSAHAETAMPFFKQEIFEASEKTTGLDSQEYKDIYNKTHIQSMEFIDQLFEDNKLDACCGLTSGPASSIDLLYGDKWGDVYSGTPAAITGYPHITVPCGNVFGLPLGFSFFSTAYREGNLIEMAFAYEQLTNERQLPQFIKMLEG